MEKNSDIFNIETINSFVFSNSFGVLFKEALILNHFNKTVPIYLHQVNKIIINKKRIFIPNFCVFFVSILFYLILYYSGSQMSFYFKTILFFFALSLLFTSFIFKKNKYKLVVVRKENDAIKIDFSSKYKRDAITIMRKINKNIKELEN